jgi:tripartite-type tricarboxylate transporter receptor subunit TctC
MQEGGLKGYDLVGWFGLWLPANAHADLVARIHADLVRALSEADIKQRFDEVGLEAVGSKPEAFAKFVAEDVRFMRDLARKIEAMKK